MNIYNHKFKKFINQDKYLCERDFDTFLQTTELELSLKKYLETNKLSLLKKHNNTYLNETLNKKRNYFNHLFDQYNPNIKLDENQRKAIIADENLLVIAGAGAGKTTTMAAKVKYLIDSGYQESEILVLSYTKKACEEIQAIIHKFLNCPNIKVSTFHSLGLELIKSTGRNIDKVIEDNDKYKIFSNFLKNIAFEDKNFLAKLHYNFSSYIHLNENASKYQNFNDYHQNAYQEKFQRTGFDLDNYINKQIENRRKRKKTIKGEFLRSKEEVDIANFLYLNSINYEYELTYIDKINNTKTHPDFYIKQQELENYIEHFGVDQNLDNKMFDNNELKNYINNLKAKHHYINETDKSNRFIVTYSKYNNNTTYLSSLKQQLIEKGYTLTKRTNESIFKTLMETDTESYFSNFIIDILIPFIANFKKNNYTLEDFDTLKQFTTKELKEQLDILKKVYLYYQNFLEEKHYIDFDDMINIAHSIIPKLNQVPNRTLYKYLIIDEYQDISNQRYNLTKALSDLYDAKIMAVGDDWQTIFSFAGADITLFQNFEKFINNAKCIPIENTYRNSQELIDIAKKFIEKNKHQIKKTLKSNKHLSNPIEIYVYDDHNKILENTAKAKAINTIISKIYENNPEHKILLLGRYNKDKESILYTDYFIENRKKIIAQASPKADLTFLTIHKAKGLGFDDVILTNGSNELYGFPSKIEDIPIIKLLKNNFNEEIPYPEERRLFYVAMTRTKNKFYVVVPKSKVSTFVKEISTYTNVIINQEIITCDTPVKTNYYCPNCNHHLNIINYRNTEYHIYVCSNETCHFQTSFPKKLEPLENCPKCKSIVTYRYTTPNNQKIYRCFNPNCNFTILKKEESKYPPA